jgi:hypothetical protein
MDQPGGRHHRLYHAILRPGATGALGIRALLVLPRTPAAPASRAARSARSRSRGKSRGASAFSTNGAAWSSRRFKWLLFDLERNVGLRGLQRAFTSRALRRSFFMFGGGSDANIVEGSGGHLGRVGGGRVESGNGEVPLCGGLQILQPRLPPGAVVGAWKLGIRTGAVTGLWKPGSRRGVWDGGRGRERGCKCRSRGCGRWRSARHRERCGHRHLQYAFGALGCEAWEGPRLYARVNPPYSADRAAHPLGLRVIPRHAGAGEGSKVCRLSAGGKRIRTAGPTYAKRAQWLGGDRVGGARATAGRCADLFFFSTPHWRARSSPAGVPG